MILKDHEMKEICVVVGAKECMVSPESFSFTDKHAAASVNKIHREKKWDTFDSHKGFFPLNEQRSNKICVSEVPCSLKQWSINLEQILFLLQRYYFNFYARVKKGNVGGPPSVLPSFPTYKYAVSQFKLSPRMPPDLVAPLKKQFCFKMKKQFSLVL